VEELSVVFRNMKERDNLGILEADGRVIIKLILTRTSLRQERDW
jgi:hypothetical protein